MAISADLGEVLEKVVADLVENGRYNSKSEVLREGMRLVRSVRHGCGNWIRSWRKNRLTLMRGRVRDAEDVFDELLARYTDEPGKASE